MRALLSALLAAALVLSGAWVHQTQIAAREQPHGAFAGAAAPAADGFGALVRGLAEDAGWTGQSINFRRGFGDEAALSPVLLVACWAAAAGGLFVLFTGSADRERAGTAVALFVLAGWLVLDLHWQQGLLARLAATYEASGKVALEERNRATADPGLIEKADLIEEALPATPARILILSRDPGATLPQRLRYHLAPHRAFAGLSSLPAPEHLRTGPHVLVLFGTRGVRYDPGAGALISDGRAVPARLVAPVPGLGRLYQIGGG